MIRPSSLRLLLAASSALISLWATPVSAFCIPAAVHRSCQPIHRKFVSCSPSLSPRFTSQLHLSDEPTESDTDPIESEIDASAAEVDIAEASVMHVDISDEEKKQGEDTLASGSSSEASVVNGDDADEEEVEVLLPAVTVSDGSLLKVGITEEGHVGVSLSPSKLSKLKSLLGMGPKKDGEEQLSFRQKLAKAGLAVALSYGAVSNATYSVCMSIAWYGFSIKVSVVAQVSKCYSDYVVFLTHSR